MSKFRAQSPPSSFFDSPKDFAFEKTSPRSFEEDIETLYHRPTSTVIRPEQKHRISIGE